MKLQGMNFDPLDFHVRCLAPILNLSCQASLKVLKNAAPSSSAVTDSTDDDVEQDDDVTSPHKDLSVYSRV